MPIEDDHVNDQLEAYAAGALDAEETRAVELHLARCESCRLAASALDEVVARLPLALFAAAPLHPPDSLKDRVMGSAQSAAGMTDRRPVEQMPDAGSNVPEFRPEPPTRSSPPDSGYWNLRTAAVAAAALLLAVSLVLGVRLGQALDREDQLREQIANVYTRQQEIVLEVVDSDQTQRMVLRAENDESNAYGKVFTRSDLPHVVAMAARLPPPPDGLRYHLWLTESGRTELGGILMLNDDGFGLLTFDASADGPVYERAVLTLQEPGGDAPAGETVLVWPEPGE